MNADGCAGGIIFSAESICAIRDGRKTQTRRMCSRAIDHDGEMAKSVWPDGDGTGWIAWFGPFEVSAEETRRRYPGAEGFLPRYRVGKRYYVKEKWAPHRHMTTPDPELVAYWCDCEDVCSDDLASWRSPMVMPRWAARYAIEVTAVRAQRLQDITEEDAVAEAVACWMCGSRTDGTSENDCPCFHSRQMARDSLALAWDAINKRSPFSSNPWVFAYTFRLVQP